MTKPLRVLLVEDSEDDAVLLARTLRRDGLDVTTARVDTPEDLAEVLENETWDIVLSDYSMPRFNGLEALRQVRRKDPNLPFIIISGAIGEEVAVSVMKAGAQDYLMKDNLTRLVSAVKRELAEARTRRKREEAEKELRESEQRFRALFDRAGDALFLVDPEGGFVDVNQRACEDLGYSRDELLALSVPDIDPAHPKEKFAEFVEGLDPETPMTFESVVHRKDGSAFPVEIRIGWIDLHGNPHMLALVRDITKRKRDESELNRVNQLLQTSVDQMPVAYITWDREFRVVEWNHAAERIFGYAKSEMVGKNLMERIVPEPARPPVQEVLEQLLAGEKASYAGAGNNIRKDGTVITCQWYNTPLKNQKGEVFAVLSMAIDVTERKKAEEERSRLITAIEQAAEDIIVTDAQGRIEYVNPAFERITGYSRKEAIGRNPRLLQSGIHDEAFYREMWDTVNRGETWTGRITNKKKDGTLFEEDATITAIMNPEGAVTGYVSVKRDVTEQRRLEAQLSQTQKLEAIGTVAGGIAHDFNNILASMILNVEMLGDNIPREDPAFERLNLILKSAERARDLVRQILTFSRPDEESKVPVHLSPLIREALRFLRASLPTTVEMRQELRAGKDSVLASRVKIHQVIMNLCTNAAYAMRETGGTLAITLDELDLDEEEAKAYLGLAPGPYLRLTVGDTGAGMTPEVAERIFEPFFTTKPQGEGTGMGLAVVHGIIRDHDGNITVYSEPSQGSTFKVLLPRFEAEEFAKPAEPTPAPGGTERILLVDDEEIIAEAQQLTLERLGYTVRAFSDSEKAWETFQKEPQAFDLVLTDQTMPGITGIQLARRMLQTRPDLPIILCTGFSETVTEAKAREAGVKEFLMKPLTKGILATSVRRVLDNSKSEGKE